MLERRTPAAALAILLASGIAVTLGQTHTPSGDCPLQRSKAEVTSASPYVGLEAREIKALSEEQRQELLDGHGMGLALAAELNHYPGPKHVLELAPSPSALACWLMCSTKRGLISTA